VSRALDLLAALRLLPSPLLSVWIYRLALSIGEDAERAAARAHRAIGERDEARRDRDLARGAERACYEREAATARRVEEQAKALQSALAVANRSCVELQGEVDTARAERDALAVEAQGLRATIAEHRAHLAAKGSEVVEAPCAWCLEPSVDGLGFATWDDAVRTWNHLCRKHDTSPLDHLIRARVADRGASCPARRTSPDPLAVECINCGALAGAMCTP
jgi:hypothetical protein